MATQVRLARGARPERRPQPEAVRKREPAGRGARCPVRAAELPSSAAADAFQATYEQPGEKLRAQALDITCFETSTSLPCAVPARNLHGCRA